MSFSIDQIQRVADTYSIGQITAWKEYDNAVLVSSENVTLNIYFLKTDRGMYCLVGAESNKILTTRIALTPTNLIKKIALSVGLEFAQIQSTQPSPLYLTHKFDYNFFLFKV
jgi:hypothetical protein